MKVRSLLFFVFWNIVSINAQINEKFINLNAWNFNLDQWVLDNEALKSNCNLANSSFQITAPNSLVTNCVWKINCNLMFSTSSLNYVDFYLLADNQNLTTVSYAYFVRIGSTTDDICLYKKSNSTIIKIIDGIDGRSQSSASNNQIQIKVIRNSNYEFTLFSDIESDGEKYMEEGRAIDTEFKTGAFAGLSIHQSTSSFFGKHLFDNLIIQTIQEDSIEIITPKPIPKVGYIILTEVLFNPKPNGVDFIEIYNNSSEIFKLSDLCIANEKGDTVNFKSSKQLLLPNQFYALCIDSNNVLNNYPSNKQKNIIQIPKLPSMNDDIGFVAVLNDDFICLDSLTYSEKIHFELITDNEGVSLEKINILPQYNYSNWHSASTNIGYATPGYLNSQYLNSNYSTKNFFVSSKVFSPNEDGDKDFLLLNYLLPKHGVTASINVFNTNGYIVKQLANNHLLATNGVYQWNGTTDKGEKAQNGYYLIRVDMLNLNGENEYSEIPVVLWCE